MLECDLFVIGGGSGGVRAARRAAERGARVVLAEKGRLGGTCVNVGCVPKKLYFYAAGYADEWRRTAAYGREEAALGPINWAQFMRRKDSEIARLNGIYRRMLESAGAQVINGAARLEGGAAVRVGDEVYQAKRILLAAGGEPARATIPGGELAAVSDDLFALKALPKSVVVLGGGYIALEFAGIFAGLGAQTMLCYRADLPMRGLDDDIRRRLAAGIKEHGVGVRAGAAAAAIERLGGGYRAILDDGKELEAELVVAALGRRPATASLGLETAGIAPRDDGTLEVDADFRCSCPTVHAIGDLLQTPALTPVAIAEAEAFVRRMFEGDKTAAVDYETMPTAVFSRPALATCGISENAAARRGLKVAVYEGTFRAMKEGFAGETGESFIKLLVDADNGRVIGAQMLGEQAAEILQGIAIAIKAGATKADFDETIGIHPTAAEEFVSLRQQRARQR